MERGVEPVGAPLPDVAGRVVQPVAVGREGIDGCRPHVAVVGRVLDGERALEDVAHRLAVGREVVAPDVTLLDEPAPGRELPLGLGREPHAGPGAVGGGVVPGDVPDRVITHAIEVGLGAARMPPVGPVDLPPPLSRSHGPSGREVVGEEHVEHERPAISLRLGRVPGGVDELRELLIRDRAAGDTEWPQGHCPNRPLAVGGESDLVLRAHDERPSLEGGEVELHNRVSRRCGFPPHRQRRIVRHRASAWRTAIFLRTRHQPLLADGTSGATGSV
jgi:hypothetical protein